MKVSSTKVRHALELGDVRTANDLLGYPYQLGGVVVKGDDGPTRIIRNSRARLCDLLE